MTGYDIASTGYDIASTCYDMLTCWPCRHTAILHAYFRICRQPSVPVCWYAYTLTFQLAARPPCRHAYMLTCLHSSCAARPACPHTNVVTRWYSSTLTCWPIDLLTTSPAMVEFRPPKPWSVAEIQARFLLTFLRWQN